MKTLLKIIILLQVVLSCNSVDAQVFEYPWKDLDTYTRFETTQLVSENSLISTRYAVRVRDLTNNGAWVSITTLNCLPRIHAEHPITGDNAVIAYQQDRTMSFTPFAFTGQVEIEVTKIYGAAAATVEISPKAYELNPHYFDGRVIRFVMSKWGYVSINFVSADNQDDDNKGGKNIKNGLMLFADYPETVTNDYIIPNPTDNNVIVWNNQTDIETLRNADILYFPAGLHQLKAHKDNVQKYETVATTMKNYPLYHGQLRLKKAQKIYLAPGAYVLGAIKTNGITGCWLYGRGIISGRDHWMHEVVIPNIVNGSWVLETATKEAFVDFNGTDYGKMMGVTIMEAFHHTCPSGSNTYQKNLKILGYCYNNDGIRPGTGSVADGLFIKTDDDYDYARSEHLVRNSVFWPPLNGSVGQLGWGNLGDGFAKYYDNYLINSEMANPGKGNSGMFGSQADAGIKLVDNVIENLTIENPTPYLIIANIAAGSLTGYLKNFRFKNIKVEYPFAFPNGTISKQIMKGTTGNDITGWTFTNLVVDGKLVTWSNYDQFFDLNLIGANGANTDASKFVNNITFNSLGTIYNITGTKNTGGIVRPQGNAGVIDCPANTNQTVYFTPSSGYRIKDVQINGVSKGAIQTYTFRNVTSNQTVAVEFETAANTWDYPVSASTQKKTNIELQNISGSKLKGLDVIVDLKKVITNDDGICEFNLYPGEYTAYIYKTGQQVADKKFVVAEQNQKVLIQFDYVTTAYEGVPWKLNPWDFGSDNTQNFLSENRVLGWKYDIGKVSLPVSPAVRLTVTEFQADHTIVATYTQNKAVSASFSDIRGVQAATSNLNLEDNDNLARSGRGDLVWKSDRSTFDQGGAATRYTCWFNAGTYKVLTREFSNAGNGNFTHTFRIIRKSDWNVIYTESMNNFTAMTNGVILANNTQVLFPEYQLLGITEAANVLWCRYNKDFVIDADGEYLVEYNHDKAPSLGGSLGEFTFEYIPAATDVKNQFQIPTMKAILHSNNILTISEANQFEILDLGGRVLIKRNLKSSIENIQLNIAGGLYLVRMKNGIQILSTKIIVK